MRLRNIKGALEIISIEDFVVKEPEKWRGCWNAFFHSDSEIHIEIGMGKGSFLIAMAQRFPDVNFIGIEKYSSVLLRAVEKQRELQLPNLVFLRHYAEYITDIFAEDEISRIYLNFSDPWPRNYHAKRRLTSKQFLGRYNSFLKPGGFVIFKTDNRDLFDFSIRQAEGAGFITESVTYNLHGSGFAEDNIMTEYEKRFMAMGKSICRLVLQKGK